MEAYSARFRSPCTRLSGASRQGNADGSPCSSAVAPARPELHSLAAARASNRVRIGPENLATAVVVARMSLLDLSRRTVGEEGGRWDRHVYSAANDIMLRIYQVSSCGLLGGVEWGVLGVVL